MSFSKKLRELREERQLTQTEVAKAIGVDKSYVSGWENNRGNPSLESVVAISKFFGVSLDYLIFENIPREGVEAINDFELYEYFRKSEALPKDAKQAIKELVDAVVLKYKISEMPEAKISASTPEKRQTGPLRKVAGKR